jgi:hypothetical protein
MSEGMNRVLNVSTSGKVLCSVELSETVTTQWVYSSRTAFTIKFCQLCQNIKTYELAMH